MPPFAQINVTPQEIEQRLNTAPVREGIFNLERGANRVQEDYAKAGRSIGQLGVVANELDDKIKKYQTSQELIHGTAAMTNLELKQTQAWHDFLQTPDALNPENQQAFREQQNKELEDFAGTFKTDDAQLHFAEVIGRYQESRANREMADIANLSAAHTVGAITATGIQAQHLAYADVDGLDRANALLDSAHQGVMVDPNVPAEVKAKIDNEFQKLRANNAIAAARGMIDRDQTPDKAQAIADVAKRFAPGTPDGKDLSTEQYEAIQSAAKAEAQMQHQQAEIKRTNDERVARANYDTASTNLILNPPVDAAGHFDPTAYAKQLSTLAEIRTPDGGRVMTQGEAQSLVHYQEFLSSGIQKATTQGTMDTLLQNAAKGVLPTKTQILQMMSETRPGMPHLDRGDGEFMLNQIKSVTASDDAKVIAAGVKQAASTIMTQVYGPTGSTNQYTPGGDAAVTKFKTWFYPELRRQMAAGHTLDELLNPKSPLYMLAPDRLLQFKTTDDDVLNAATGTGQGNAPAAKANLPPLKITIGGQ